MNRGNLTVCARRSLFTAAIVLAVSATITGEAWASCFTSSNGNPLAPASNPLAKKSQYAAGASAFDEDHGGTVVGLWNSQFLLSNGDLYDESFQQFHNDGTEMMLSRGLPPPLGNVCVGIWKQDGRTYNTYKLKHMAWNWDSDGNYVSIFVMEVTLRVDRRGNRYTGTWRADNLNKDTGQPIPGEHVEGTVRGARITAD